VEAQAIDRAHRIGQTRHVLATRIVARDTIEEKILELQASKRALADAILGQDQGVLAQIGRAELEMLLS
jgi:SNF2 family DNA or RNA helicase